MSETLTLKNPTAVEEKAHSWRRCPMGKHLVREHPEHISPSKTHPEGMVSTIQEHCGKKYNPKPMNDLHTYYKQLQEYQK